MEGGETVDSMYGMRQESIFNYNKKNEQSSENFYVLPISYGSRTENEDEGCLDIKYMLWKDGQT